MKGLGEWFAKCLLAVIAVFLVTAAGIVFYYAGYDAGYNDADLEWSEYHNSEYQKLCATA